MFDKEHLYIIPYNIPLEKASAIFEKYLIVFEDAEGNIVSGIISTVVYDKKDLLVLDLTKKKELLLMNDVNNILGPDTIIMNFGKKEKTIPLTISKVLDQLTGLKLYSFRMLYNSKFSNADNMQLPKREFFIKIGEREENDSLLIKNFIERFIKTHQF